MVLPQLVPVGKGKTKGRVPKKMPEPSETVKPTSLYAQLRKVDVVRPKSKQTEVEQVPVIGSPEPSRRLPGMRMTGSAGGGRVSKYIGALYDSEANVKEAPHYRERKARVHSKMESPLVTRIAHSEAMSQVDKKLPVEHKADVPVKAPKEVKEKMVVDDKHGEKPVMTGEDTSLVEPMPETGMPSANEEAMKKKPEIPPAPVEVVNANEPSIRMWKELRLGEYLPVGSISPSLVINPMPVREMIVSKATGQAVNEVVMPKKERKPRKKKVMEGMTTVAVEEEEMEEPKGLVKKEVMKIEKTEKKKRGASSYNQFVQQHRKAGKSMKEIGEMWRASKK